jgi:hypothetical protein
MGEARGPVNPVREAIADIITEAMKQGIPTSDGDGYDRYHYVNKIGEVADIDVYVPR